MISEQTKHKENDIVYVPFWVLLDHLDAAVPSPFIKCTIVKVETKRYQSPDGPVEIDACDLNLHKLGLTASSIPSSYLIAPDRLEYWAKQIADWFLSAKE